MMTIEEFCDKHGACCEGRDWALANCADMTEVWQEARPAWLVWVATRQDVLTDRKLRLFACACARKFWHLITDERSKNAIEVAERYAEGRATDEELETAWAAARAALAAAEAALAAEAAWAAAEAAWESARPRAREAARMAAWTAATAAALEAQAQWLRDKTTPNFD